LALSWLSFFSKAFWFGVGSRLSWPRISANRNTRVLTRGEGYTSISLIVSLWLFLTCCIITSILAFASEFANVFNQFPKMTMRGEDPIQALRNVIIAQGDLRPLLGFCVSSFYYNPLFLESCQSIGQGFFVDRFKIALLMQRLSLFLITNVTNAASYQITLIVECLAQGL
jgi:hypothetical protein